VRGAAAVTIKIMFRMIAILAEWRKAHGILEEVRAAAEHYRGPVPKKIEVGIIMYIPATALRPTRFATEVDFISVGTNDLAQYAFAAEWASAHFARLADAFRPAILHLIQMVRVAVHLRGKWLTPGSRIDSGMEHAGGDILVEGELALSSRIGSWCAPGPLHDAAA